MSRIGKQPIALPSGVTVEVKDAKVVVKGPKGELQQALHPYVAVTVEENEAVVSVKNPDIKKERAMWGTFTSLIQNMVQGVTEGFERKLEIKGVGYGWQVSGKKVTVKAGYSHPVEYSLPEGIEASVEGNMLTIAGIDKQRVGEVAANIRKIRKPEPYKGTGIKYDDEQIIRKAGKSGTE